MSLPDFYAQHAGSPSGRLLSDAYRIPVERAVSEYYRSSWRVNHFHDLHEKASHPAAILADGARGVFVKLSEALHARDQFEKERAGLQFITSQSGVQTPAPVGIVAVPGGEVLVLEAVTTVPRTANHWREMGRTLAQMHSARGAHFGLEMQGYFGPLYQDNRPMPGGMDFFIERRLWPRLIGAVDSGHLPTETIRQAERLIARLPGMGLPEAPPVLLHGDAQQNNFLSTPAGTLVIDPAPYYGDPEWDLALVDYFAPVPAEFWQGYREIAPIDTGFAERRDLWRIPSWLGVVSVDGSYLPRLTEALRRYTAA